MPPGSLDRLRRCLVLAAAPLLLALGAHGQLWVDASAPAGGNGSAGAPYQTIGEAIAAAGRGTVIQVRPGTYAENVDFGAVLALHVTSTSGPALTTIDGGLAGPAATLAGEAQVLAGFTLTGGTGATVAAGYTLGGGVLVRGPTTITKVVQNCEIRGCSADRGGGIGIEETVSGVVVTGCLVEDNLGSFGAGIGAFGSNVDVTACTIEDNLDGTGCGSGEGGGVWASSTTRVLGCTIRKNVGARRGGGVFGGEVELSLVTTNEAAAGAGLAFSVATGCTIVSNLATDCTGGFALGGGADACTLTDCTLEGNFASDYGGGAASSTLVGCTVLRNAVGSPLDPTGAKGAGAYLSDLDDCLVSMNTAVGVAGGFSPSQGGGLFGGSAVRTLVRENGGDFGAGTSATDLDRCTVIENLGIGANGGGDLRNSILRDNAGPSLAGLPTVEYCNVEGGYPGTGNFDAEPGYWRPDGGPDGTAEPDFRLRPGSPCIDAGDPASPLDPDGSIADIGAFAFDPTFCIDPLPYCTAGTTSSGCNATLGWTGTADAGAPSGFTITAANVEGDRSGIFFYGVNGPQTDPWGMGSPSVLCVRAPTQRTNVQDSGGTSGACDGTFALDFNAYLASNPGALGAPFVAGDSVWMQAWFRDPPSPKTTSLSNALEFSLCP